MQTIKNAHKSFGGMSVHDISGRGEEGYKEQDVHSNQRVQTTDKKEKAETSTSWFTPDMFMVEGC